MGYPTLCEQHLLVAMQTQGKWKAQFCFGLFAFTPAGKVIYSAAARAASLFDFTNRTSFKVLLTQADDQELFKNPQAFITRWTAEACSLVDWVIIRFAASPV